MGDRKSETLSMWFQQQSGKWLDLVVAGRVFGGRHGESPQRPRGYRYDARSLLIYFNTTEVLKIVEPDDFVFGEYGQFIVPRAKVVSFGWHYYGRPPTAEYRCEEIYRWVGNMVEMSHTGPLMPCEERFPFQSGPFVELR